MLLKLFRALGAVLAGLVLAVFGLCLVELMSSVLHPPPPDMLPGDMEACRLHVSRYPAGVLFVCAIGWWLTVLASCWLATRLGSRRHAAHGIVVGAIMLAMAIFNMAMLPYPLWFWINLIAFPASSFVGVRLARRGIIAT